MAIAFVKKITGNGAAVNTFTLTFGSNTVAGNFLAALYAAYDGGTPPNATPTGLGTWNTTTAPTPQNGANAFVNYNENCSAGTQVTVDYGTAFYIEGGVSEFSGLATATSIDQQTSNSNASSTTPTSGTTGTTTQADELVLACLSVSSSSTNVGIDAATTGYTNIHVNQDSSATIGHSSDYKIVAATGTQSAAWGTLSAAEPWSAKIATFKQAAAGGATLVHRGLLLGVGI